QVDRRRRSEGARAAWEISPRVGAVCAADCTDPAGQGAPDDQAEGDRGQQAADEMEWAAGEDDPQAGGDEEDWPEAPRIANHRPIQPAQLDCQRDRAERYEEDSPLKE